MPSREEMIATLRRRDMITALQAQASPDLGEPTGMEMLSQFGRGTLPLMNELRGGVDAGIAMATGEGDGRGFMDLQRRFSDDQDEDQRRIKEQAPGLSMALEGLGMASTIGLGGGGTVAKGVRYGDDVAKAAAKALKPRMRVPAGVVPKRTFNPQYSVRIPAQVKNIEAPVTASGGLKSALGYGAEIAGATSLAGPAGGLVAAGFGTPLGRKMIAKTARKLGGDDIGDIATHALNYGNRKWLKQLAEKLRRAEQ